MRILTSAFTSLLMLGTASAADMVRPVYKAPIAPPPAPTWTGFYVGVNVGGAAAKGDLDFSIAGGPAFASIDNAFSGIAGGGQIGYNGIRPFVAGFETDFQGSNLKGALVAPCTPRSAVPAAAHPTARASGSEPRGRIGYAQVQLADLRDRRLRLCQPRNQCACHRGTAGCELQPARSKRLVVGAGIEVGLARTGRETRIPPCRFRQRRIPGRRPPPAAAAPGL